ncbi:MAG: cobalt transporter CbiM [Bryobacteraceae bacterium]|nr:cobalt transporter CbiM [Bryobacteraceae bacterium]
MHIPDGYLSPSTCAVLYAGAAPFWYVAARRVKKLLHTRLIPLISLFAAFSFVLMMFNLPLPGGTTGHAAGIAIAAIVLGTWPSILAISCALIIQALFFGDGGITAIGANCFNMAIAGSLVASAAYQLIAGSSGLESRRRLFAAGIAGYLAINAAALLAAIEFGLQPQFFRDATGAPLYAPYPLGIAIPAMMLGHLTVAGLAELFVTAGLVAWIQKSDPALLKLTAPAGAISEVSAAAERPERRFRHSSLWATLGVLMILTPLGILAVGTAWGEWGVSSFSDPGERDAMAAASMNTAPPAAAPSGLARLSSVWTAPIPGYAPPFLKSEQFGYMLSAMLGVGLVVSTVHLIGWIGARSKS